MLFLKWLWMINLLKNGFHNKSFIPVIRFGWVCCCTHPKQMTGIGQLTRGTFRINDLLWNPYFRKPPIIFDLAEKYEVFPSPKIYKLLPLSSTLEQSTLTIKTIEEAAAHIIWPIRFCFKPNMLFRRAENDMDPDSILW